MEIDPEWIEDDGYDYAIDPWTRQTLLIKNTKGKNYTAS